MAVKKRKNVSTAANLSTLLSVDLCNIRGLHSNLNAVHYHLESAKPDLFFLTETQISPPDDTSYLNYPGYKLEHRFLSKAGVCMFIRDDICYRRLDSLEGPNLSILWIRVEYGGQSRIYACLYRSYSGDAETDRLVEHVQDTADILLQQLPSAELVILGDFNAHHKEWLSSRITDHAGRVVLDFALANNLTQLITEPTRIPQDPGDHASTLDLLLTPSPNDYVVSVEAPLGTSDHCLIRSRVRIMHHNRSRPTGHRRVWHFGSADWDGLREFFASYPWRQLCFSSDDPSVCADTVADVLLQGMACFIPNSVVPVGGKARPWFDKSCAEDSKRKRESYLAYTAAQVDRNPNASNLKKEYNAASRAFKRRISRAKFKHISKIGEKLTGFPSGSRAFWSLAKAVQGNFCRSSFPPLRKPDDELVYDAKDKADLLACLFASNSTLDDGGETPPTIPRWESSMPEIRITQKDVRRALLSLDTRKASGPDNIPAIMLKVCAPELVPILTRLFKMSYSAGMVPSSWKSALVHPIPKKGDRSDPSNYRPIAITSLLSKVMERIINTQLLSYLEDHQLISDHQYGFRHGRSAGDLLVYLTHLWAEAIESKGEALAASLDIAKAFDRVWHGALLSKLPSYGLPERLCAWIANFLSDRSIKVVVDGACSEVKSINAGVPQGSVLSPTLFILHINDMLQINDIHCYADDSTGHALYKGRAGASRGSVEDNRNELVSDIESLLEQVSHWGQLNLVKFNPTKTQVCAFTAKKAPFIKAPKFQDTSLEISSSLYILGLDISKEVQFYDHLEDKAKLTSKKLGVLNRAKRYFDPAQRLMLYKAQIRPHMEYCSHLWAGAPHYQLLPFERIQKRAVRIADDPRLSDSLEPLDLRRNVGSLSVFYRIFNGECSEELFNLVPAAQFRYRTTRRGNRLHAHHLEAWRSSTTRFSRSFLPRVCKMWNELPPTVFPQSYDLGSFKRRVNSYLKGRQRSVNNSDVADVHGRR